MRLTCNSYTLSDWEGSTYDGLKQQGDLRSMGEGGSYLALEGREARLTKVGAVVLPVSTTCA
jgi:hypothetical protein